MPVNDDVAAVAMELEARYGCLLHPIRDLSKNWEVDIGVLLEDFLSELGMSLLSLSCVMTSLDFIRAALLIQGSTTVYCKKVEYLISLCEQTRHVINNERKLQRSENESPKEREICDNSSYDDFCSLDDIKEQKNVHTFNDMNNAEKSTRIKQLPLTPIVLVPLDDREKGDDVLLNAEGNLNGHRRDYHLNICHLGSSGALLVPMSCSEITEGYAARCETFSKRPLISRPCSEEKEVVLSGEAQAAESNVNNVDPVDDDFMETCAPSPLDSSLSECCNNVRKEDHSNRRRSSRIAFKMQNEIRKHKDPWESDIFNEVLLRPVKKCKTRRSANLSNRRRKAGINASNKRQESIVEFCSKAFYSQSPRGTKNSLKTPQMPVFTDIYWEQTKETGNSFDENCRNDDEQLHNYSPAEDFDFNEDLNHDALSESSDKGAEDSPCVQPTEQALTHIPVVPTYDELVHKNVEAYLQSLAHYCIPTDLSKKVNEWERKIKPVLEDEKKREAFDIDKYENRIMQKFPINNRKQSVQFSDICKGKKKWEVCRYFSATLQLVNSCNVSVNGSEDIKDNGDFEVTLLAPMTQFDHTHENADAPFLIRDE